MAVTFHLDNFEGPLDLLLHLIQKNKVSIYDIPVAVILEQYMAALQREETLDMDLAGDFIAMAAQLIYIKSRMLLPSETEEEEDPRAQLVEMLLEYQRIKRATPYFHQQTDRARDVFCRQPEPSGPPGAVDYHGSTAQLAAAAQSILRRAQHRMPPPIDSFAGIVGHEPVPVSGQIVRVLRRFLRTPRLLFRRLFEDASSRSEVVATFLAVLELSKTRRVHIEGEGERTELTLAKEEQTL